MSSTQIIVLTLLLFTASTLDYFQLRSVYSVGNPRDSICYYLGWQEADDIHLNFNIDGFELK